MNWVEWMLMGAAFGFGAGLLMIVGLMVLLSANLIDDRKWWRIW
jgi:hypothetical protein